MSYGYRRRRRGLPVFIRLWIFIMFAICFCLVVMVAKKELEKREANIIKQEDIKKAQAVTTTTSIEYVPKTNWKGYPE